MKNLLVFGLLVLALVFVQFAQAQTVDEIINKHIDSLGGKDNLNKIQNTIEEGNMTAQGAEIAITITKVQNKLTRQDISVMGMTGYDMLTDKEGWTYMPFMGMQQPEAKSADDVKANQKNLDIAGPLVDYAAKGHKAELQGKEAVNGSECFKIKLTTAGGKDITYYIDPATYLISRASEKINVNGEDIDVQMDYADYKEVESVKMAHSITNQYGTIYISSIKVNQTIPESAYKHDY
ncbi:MAG: hypothetical protein WBP16_15610 [Ferruginibacter sp.]